MYLVKINDRWYGKRTFKVLGFELKNKVTVEKTKITYENGVEKESIEKNTFEIIPRMLMAIKKNGKIHTHVIPNIEEKEYEVIKLETQDGVPVQPK